MTTTYDYILVAQDVLVKALQKRHSPLQTSTSIVFHTLDLKINENLPCRTVEIVLFQFCECSTGIMLLKSLRAEGIDGWVQHFFQTSIYPQHCFLILHSTLMDYKCDTMAVVSQRSPWRSRNSTRFIKTIHPQDRQLSSRQLRSILNSDVQSLFLSASNTSWPSSALYNNLAAISHVPLLGSGCLICCEWTQRVGMTSLSRADKRRSLWDRSAVRI